MSQPACGSSCKPLTVGYSCLCERERRCRGAGVGPAPAGGCLQVAAARSLPTVTPTLEKTPKAPTRFGARKRFSRVSVAMTTSRRRHLIIDLCMTRGYSQNKALALRSAPWSCAVWVVGWMDGRSGTLERGRREKRGTNKVFNVRDGLPPAGSTQAILSANQVSGEGSLWGM